MNKLPGWFKQEIPNNETYFKVKGILKDLKLHTVCKEAKCPNVCECYSKGKATFMILGDVCTRNCAFCGITKGVPRQPDEQEPENIKKAVEKLGLSYVVITSVTRDDLSDGGAQHFAQTISQIKSLGNNIKVEVLTPDFQGKDDAIKIVCDAGPEVFNHNMETVKELYSTIRNMACYERSLEFLKNVKAYNKNIMTKSGLMLGLGEEKEQVIQLLKDLKSVDCDIVTIGQYLKPTNSSATVKRYVSPEEFKEYEIIAAKMGFKKVFSGPLVRSSYVAD